MPDVSEPTAAPGGKMRRIALTAKEEQLIADYRRKTQADQAWNAALDHAIEVVDNTPVAHGDIAVYSAEVRHNILKAFRDV